MPASKYNGKPNFSCHEGNGKGNDRLGGKKDGLKLKWQWITQSSLSGAPEDDKRRLPCQTCEAELVTKIWVKKHYWTFKVRSSYSDGYEAEVRFGGDVLLRQQDCETRLLAQQHAEMMFKEFLEGTLLEASPVMGPSRGERRIEAMEEQLNGALSLMRGIPQGYCKPCQQVWLDRTKEAIADVKKMFEDAGVAVDDKPKRRRGRRSRSKRRGGKPIFPTNPLAGLLLEANDEHL